MDLERTDKYRDRGRRHDDRRNCRRCDTPAAAQARIDARRFFVGRYCLSGVREVGSELLLRPDGSFAWFMSYGAVDQAAEGKWQASGDTSCSMPPHRAKDADAPLNNCGCPSTGMRYGCQTAGGGMCASHD